MRHRQWLIEKQRPPQHAEQRDQKGRSHRFHRTNRAQEAEVNNVRKRRASQTQPQQREPDTPAAPGRGWLADHAVAEQRQQEQRRAEHAAHCRQTAVETTGLIEPAAGQKPRKSIAGGREQAGDGTHQQFQIERHRTGTGQHAHAEQPQEHAAEFGASEPFMEKQAADQHAHQGGRGIENRRVTGW
ncbi:hypothetical protein D3C85_975120 [compost metagenome]